MQKIKVENPFYKADHCDDSNFELTWICFTRSKTLKQKNRRIWLSLKKCSDIWYCCVKWPWPKVIIRGECQIWEGATGSIFEDHTKLF